MNFHLILGKLPYSLESDPFVIKRNGIFHLYNWDLLGIKEHVSSDGLHFRFKKYLVFNALRPFVDHNNLYFEKITSYKGFPLYRSEIRSLNLNTGRESVVINQHPNSCCPSIIDNRLFYSTGLQKMPDHGLCEPTQLRIHNGPEVQGLPHISSLRKFKGKYYGTLIETSTHLSTAKIVECHPLEFPLLWKIGADFLTPSDISPTATHVYIPSFVDDRIYINVRFGRHFYSSERIVCFKLK